MLGYIYIYIVLHKSFRLMAFHKLRKIRCVDGGPGHILRVAIYVATKVVLLGKDF